MLLAAPAGALDLRFLQNLGWTVEGPDFGGFSGIVVTDEGRAFWAVSDHGTLWRVAVTRDETGRIVQAVPKWHARFLDNKGRPVEGFTSDAEALAMGEGGGLFVGYESYSRITGLMPPGMTPIPLHAWDRFEGDWGNEGFEGLARLPDGRLLAVIEAADETAGGYRTYIGRKGDWQDGPVLRADGDFGASDATVDDLGRLWLLERRVSWLGKMQVRISTCPAATTGVVDCAPVLTTKPGALGNMEGMSLWRDPKGQLIMTLISDDNFSAFGQTILAEYEVLP